MTEESKALAKSKKDGIEAVVNKLFATKTPKQFIKSRPGPGGRSLTYVEVGYVVSVLNNAFGPYWEWKITDKQIGTKQIWVEGQLTIKAPNIEITKTGFGGSAIKISTTTKEPINIANDLKAASSDALKKAASLFGIASDVFYKEMDILEESPDEVDEVSDGDEFVRQQLMGKYFAVSAVKGYSGEEAKDMIKKGYNVEHMEDLSVRQLELGIKAMEQKDFKPSETAQTEEKVEEEVVTAEEVEKIFNPEEVKEDDIPF